MKYFNSKYGTYLIIISLIMGAFMIPIKNGILGSAAQPDLETDDHRGLPVQDTPNKPTDLNSETRTASTKMRQSDQFWYDSFENQDQIESLNNVTLDNGNITLKTITNLITTTGEFDDGVKINVETHTDWSNNITNSSGVPEGELHVEFGDLYSDSFEGTPFQNLTDYDNNWVMIAGMGKDAKINTSTSYSGNMSVVITGMNPNTFSAARYLPQFTSEPLIIYVNTEHSDPTGGTKGFVQTFNGTTNLAWVGIYNKNWQYYDGATRTDTFVPYSPNTWYRIKIVHEFSNDTYCAWISGDGLDNWKIANYAALRNPGMEAVNKTTIYGGTAWAGGGGNIGTSWYDNFKVGGYFSSGSWESSNQSFPQGYKLRNTTIDFEGLIKDKQEIDSVEWFANSAIKAVYDRDIEDDLDSPKTIENNDLTLGSFADIDTDFTVKLNMVTDGTGTPIIYEIKNNLVRTNGNFTTKPIDLPWNRLWDKVELTKSQPLNTSIKITVLDGSTAQSLVNFSKIKGSVIDLSSIDALQFPRLKLRVLFSTNSSTMPILHDLKLTWKPDYPWLVKNIPSNLSIPEDTDALRFINLAQYFNDTYTPDDELFFVIYNESNSANLHASINGHYLEIITPIDHWTGNETFSVNCSDGEFAKTSNTFKVTVDSINDAPIWKDIKDIYISEGTSSNETENIIDLNNYVYDVDNTSDEVELKIVLNTNPNNISVVIDANNMIDVYVSNINYVGSAAITIRADDGLDYSDENFFIIIQPINDLPIVNLVYPDNRAILTSNNVEISWNAEDVEGAALRFDLYLTIAPDAGTIYLSNITEQQIEVTLDDGTYYWKVIPHDGTEYGECLSGIWQFSVDTSILTPTLQLISPVYNSVITTDSIELRWKVEEGFDLSSLTYEIYLDTTQQPKKIVTDHIGLVYTVQNLEDGETYYWTIIPKEVRGIGSILGKCISGVWSFKVDFNVTAPVVTLLSPGNGKTVNVEEPQLLWNVEYPAASSISYIVYVDTQIIPNKILKANHPDKYIAAAGLENGKNYYWTVIPIAGNVMGDCSSGVWMFAVDTAALAPTVELTYPVNNIKINNPNPQLTWNLQFTGTGTVSYDIYLDTSETPTQLIANDLQGETTKQASVTDNTKYYWTVIPSVGNIEGYCLSGIWNFMVDTNYTPVFNLELELSKTKMELERGQFGSIEITVTNTGNVADLIKLEFQITPTNLDMENVYLDQTEVNIASNNFDTLTLTINIPKNTKTGNYKIAITATSQGALGLDQSVSDTETLTVEVLEEGATTSSPLLMASIAILIVIIIILIILFLVTVRKKKTEPSLGETEERAITPPEAEETTGTEPEMEAAPQLAEPVAPPLLPSEEGAPQVAGTPTVPEELAPKPDVPALPPKPEEPEAPVPKVTPPGTGILPAPHEEQPEGEGDGPSAQLPTEPSTEVEKPKVPTVKSPDDAEQTPKEDEPKKEE